MIPGFDRSAVDYIPTGLMFARAGYACIAITQPGFGRSDGKRDWVGPGTLKAMEAGYDKLKKESFVDESRIGLFGFSRGALAASLMAAGRIQVKAAVFASGLYDFQNAYDTIRLEGIRENMRAETGMTDEAIKQRSSVLAMDKLACPVLILHGEDDVNTPVEQAQLLAKRLDELNRDYEIEIYKNAKHSLGGTNYMQRTVDFFNKRLKDSDHSE